ncbi:MAG: calcium/sodium antiporter [Gemmatimonadetes bacterium]|nr:calcium/sodium antiporter [Gemmatimonadota bacterium]
MAEALSLGSGLLLLVAGAELLVRSASRLAAVAGVSPLVIGLTVVAYGTSAPEMAVSVIATMHGQPDVAVGNVVGSNIFNVLFILGVSAAIAPLAVSAQLVRLDVPVMVGVSLLLLPIANDGLIGRIEGGLMVIGIAAYTTYLIRQGRSTTAAQPQRPDDRRGGKVVLDILAVAGGLALLISGSQLLVHGAIAIARDIGVSELVIGLTLVAAGTSLPELATSVLATIRGERDIAVGNVIGSNIFNILAILGVSALSGAGDVAVSSAVRRFDIPVMIGVALLCMPIFFAQRRISRLAGLLFLVYYVSYVLYLGLAASQHDALPEYSSVMLLFVLPVTIAGVLFSTLKGFKRSQ